jgi:hypothetical protein
MSDKKDDTPKEPKAKSYVVSTRKGFPYPSRTRGGLTFSAGDNNVSLTDQQYKAIKADPELTVREGGKEAKKVKTDENTDSLDQAKDSPSGNHSNVRQGYNGPGQVPLNPDTEDPAPAPKKGSGGKAQKPADGNSPEKEVKNLLKANSRDALLEQAKAAGVEVADNAEKKQIAQAIVDAKG